MEEFIYTINNPIGLHMRPAKELYELAKVLDSEVYIVFNDRTIKADSVLRIVAAGIPSESVVKFRVVGGSCRHNAELLESLVRKIL